MHPNHDIPLEEVPYSLRERVAAATLLAVMAFGAWQAVGAWRNPDALATVPRTLKDFREGRTTLAVEKQMDKHLPARERIVAFANGARYLLLRGSGDDVRAGRDGWLFLTEELRYDAPVGEPLQTRVKLLADTHAALRARGVRLVVALVPDKARIYPQQLLGGDYPDYNADRYRSALGALRRQGVEVVDLLTPFTAQASADGPLYYRTDTHWNTRGAALAADAIARAAYPDGGCSPATAYETRVSAEPTPYPGDLRRMIGLEHMPAWFPPRSDLEAAAETAARDDGGSAGGGLFGDSSVPVVLAGTSFSLRGNFHGALQQALGCAVLNTAQDGGGFLTAATEYFKDDAFQLSTPSVMVWEVPERFLTLKLEREAKFLRDAGLQP
jgi:alginate O-acetyltransferase complex protein AlgJ